MSTTQDPNNPMRDLENTRQEEQCAGQDLRRTGQEQLCTGQGQDSARQDQLCAAQGKEGARQDQHLVGNVKQCIKPLSAVYSPGSRETRPQRCSPSVAKADARVSRPNGRKRGHDNIPAEVCVVIGKNHSTQALGSYTCGICGKKYKYYNCFQTHVKAHKELSSGSKVQGSHSMGNNFRYTCDVCGKKYKYYSCFQEHRDLHTVDDPYEPLGNPKNEEQVEPFQKSGPKTGSYVCDFCGKQYKYLNRYQAHVTLHARHPCEKPCAHTQNSAGTDDHEASKVTKPEHIQKEPGSCPPEPYTCRTCGIQFQFYSNLKEHIQSHATDSKSDTKEEPLKKGLTTAFMELSAERGHSAHEHSVLSEKEHQQVAERLLRVTCANPGMLGVLSGKDFLRLAQVLVDMGARQRDFSVWDSLGDMSSLALKQLPRTYNQVKVRVTCALGSSASLGVAVTCHSQTVGPDIFCMLAAYQVEGERVKRYVLGVKVLELGETGEQLRHWVQNVLSEFVLSEVCVMYLTEPGISEMVFGRCTDAHLCCAGCCLGAVAQAVLSKRNLKVQGLHEVEELLTACQDLVRIAGLSGHMPSGTGDCSAPRPPLCWDHSVEPLLLVHECFEQLCEVLRQSKMMASFLQNLNKHLLGIIVALLYPLRQAAVELSCEPSTTLHLVLPVYLRLEKIFSSKAKDMGAGGRLSLCFLEALKENLKVAHAHRVAALLDPQQKLQGLPSHQHEETIGKVCEMASGLKQKSCGAQRAGKREAKANEDLSAEKRGRWQGSRLQTCSSHLQQVRKELSQYLAEPISCKAQDPLPYWRSMMGTYPWLTRLALWLFAMPAVGVRKDCVAVREQTLVMTSRRRPRPEEVNKLIFLKANMT